MRLTLFFLLIAHGCASYKILVWNAKYGHSHSNFLGRIADILVEAGHDVTSLIPVLDPNCTDGTFKSKKIYVETDERAIDLANASRSRIINFFDLDIMSLPAQLFVGNYLGKLFSYTCDRVIKEPGLVENLTNEKFDVLIVENFDMCGMGLSHVIKPKAVIGTSATNLMAWEFNEFGVPSAISYNPSCYIDHMDVHSFWDRAKNIYADILIRIFFRFTRLNVEAVLRDHYGADYPSMNELSSRAAYVFTNSEPLIDYATPTMTRIVPIGGIGAKEPKKLDKEWEDVLVKRPRTVLMSFGSVVKSTILPIAVKRNILEAFKQYPDVTFIWKYEDPEDEFAVNEASKVDNVHLSKWTPQVDILNHERLVLFITHGGMGSTQETALRGVPGIFVPFFGDQPRNAGMMEHNQFGIVLEKSDLGTKIFGETLKELLENDKYAENAKRVAKMLAKKPFSSEEQLIKYTEFAAEFGPSSALRPQSHDMNWIEYHNIDIILAGLIVFSLLSFVSVKLFFFVVKKFLSRKVKND